MALELRPDLGADEKQNSISDKFYDWGTYNYTRSNTKSELSHKNTIITNHLKNRSLTIQEAITVKS